MGVKHQVTYLLAVIPIMPVISWRPPFGRTATLQMAAKTTLTLPQAERPYLSDRTFTMDTTTSCGKTTRTSKYLKQE